MQPAPIAVALDGPDLNTIVRWAAESSPYVSTMKIGLETYLRDGDRAVAGIVRGLILAGDIGRVFLVLLGGRRILRERSAADEREG